MSNERIIEEINLEIERADRLNAYGFDDPQGRAFNNGWIAALRYILKRIEAKA